MIWRPIGAGLTTLAEMDDRWDLCDLLNAHEYLDIKEEAEAFYAKQK